VCTLSFLIANSEFSRGGLGMYDIMTLARSNALEQLVISINSDGGRSPVPVHVRSVRPLFPVLGHWNVSTDATRALVQVVNHRAVVVCAVVVVVLVERALGTGPVHKLRDLLLWRDSSIACSIVTHLYSLSIVDL